MTEPVGDVGEYALSTKKIPRMELFGPTIQGEGALIGIQTYFIRFGLCDYKCTMCDSIHAVDPVQVKANASWLTQEDIYWELVDHIENQKVPGAAPWMTYSGGNPCIHDLTELTAALKYSGFAINVETQGTLCPDWLQYVDMVTISPKSPGMGEAYDKVAFQKMLHFLKAHDVKAVVKVVVFNQDDLEFAAMVFEDAKEVTESIFFISQGNPYPPQHANTERLVRASEGSALTAEESQKLTLLTEFRILCESVLADARFRNVVVLPQLHVLTWANKALV